jgi:hypothetical protein
VFLPSKLDSWQKKNNGNWVTFYPFLVVMEHTSKEGRVFWMPYWHIEEGTGTKKKKYGQFASFLEEPLLKSLLAQAHAKGYLRDLTQEWKRLWKMRSDCFSKTTPYFWKIMSPSAR